MKDYLARFIGKKINILRMGVPKDVSHEGTLSEIAGEVAVLLTDEGVELGIPIEKILLVGLPEKERGGRAAGFIGD